MFTQPYHVTVWHYARDEFINAPGECSCRHRPTNKAKRNLLPRLAYRAGIPQDQQKSLHLSIISSFDDIPIFGKAWDRLVDEAPEGSVFQTFDWQTAWWRMFGENRKLRIILVKEGEDHLVGILPLYIEYVNILPLVGVRRIRLVGYGGDTAPDDLGAIVSAGADSAQVSALLADGLMSIRSQWDIAVFEDLEPNSPLIPALQNRSEGKIEIKGGARIAFVELPRSWDEYLGKLSSNRRWKLRRGRTRLNKRTPYRFHVVADRNELDVFYPELIRLHHDRWQHRSQTFGFSSDRYVEFHRSVMADMLARDCLRFMLLISKDGVIAANYCYRWKGAFYFFQGGFARAYEPYRLGEVMMGHAIEQAISEGMHSFDMLRGEHDYKKSLTDQVRKRTHLHVYRPTMRTVSYRMLRHCYRRMRQLYSRTHERHEGSDSVAA